MAQINLNYKKLKQIIHQYDNTNTMSENMKFKVLYEYKQIYHDYAIANTLSENIHYKALYELVKMENSILVKQNIELRQELDKFNNIIKINKLFKHI